MRCGKSFFFVCFLFPPPRLHLCIFCGYECVWLEKARLGLVSDVGVRNESAGSVAFGAANDVTFCHVDESHQNNPSKPNTQITPQNVRANHGGRVSKE